MPPTESGTLNAWINYHAYGSWDDRPDPGPLGQATAASSGYLELFVASFKVSDNSYVTTYQGPGDYIWDDTSRVTEGSDWFDKTGTYSRGGNNIPADNAHYYVIYLEAGISASCDFSFNDVGAGGSMTVDIGTLCGWTYVSAA